jgi:hypothetical protein
MIPAFTAVGLLPAGIHPATRSEFRSRFAGNPIRSQILGGISRAADALRIAGCQRLWVDGSFATTKDQPGDWDGCWDPTGVDLELLDPLLMDFSPRGRVRIKVKYLADLFPSTFIEQSSSSAFIEYFQVDKTTGLPKGVILLNLREAS